MLVRMQIYEATWSGIASAVRVAVEPAWQSVCAASNASEPTLYGTIKENAGARVRNLLGGSLLLALLIDDYLSSTL